MPFDIINQMEAEMQFYAGGKAWKSSTDYLNCFFDYRAKSINLGLLRLQDIDKIYYEIYIVPV
jgi:hypothetical protein